MFVFPWTFKMEIFGNTETGTCSAMVRSKLCSEIMTSETWHNQENYVTGVLKVTPSLFRYKEWKKNMSVAVNYVIPL